MILYLPIPRGSHRPIGDTWSITQRAHTCARRDAHHLRGVLDHQPACVATIADAICDRLVHNAHVLKLGGPSIRRKKALQAEPQPSA